jgi:hypothetical protein
VDQEKLKQFSNVRANFTPKEIRELVNADPETALYVLMSVGASGRIGYLLINYLHGARGIIKLVQNHSEWDQEKIDDWLSSGGIGI